MKKVLWVSLAVLAISFFAGKTLQAKTLEEIMASVQKSADALQTIKGKQNVKFLFEGELITMQNEFMAKTPDKFRSITRIPIPNSKKTQEILTVCDGTVIYQWTKKPEQEKVIKMTLASVAGKLDTYQKKFVSSGYGMADPEALLGALGSDYDIKVTGTEKLGALTMDVIQGSLKGTGGKAAKNWLFPTPAKIKYLIGQDGFIYRIVGTDKAGAVVLDIGYAGLKFNDKTVTDKLFTFKAPKGVEVFEATEIMPFAVQ